MMAPVGMYTTRRKAQKIDQTVDRNVASLIRHEIIVAAQRLLNGERGTGRRICVGSASGHHAQGPIAVDMAVGDAIYCDTHYGRTSALLSNFFQRSPPQVIHRN
jgi:hypothetical protein